MSAQHTPGPNTRRRTAFAEGTPAGLHYATAKQVMKLAHGS